MEARGRRDVLALQFALAGMNAHINRDLPLALVATCEEQGVELRDGSPQQRDFRRINPLLAQVEERVKPQLLTDDLSDVDVALGDVDDVLAMWKVERAREAAWVQAETLWALRGLPHLHARAAGDAGPPRRPRRSRAAAAGRITGPWRSPPASVGTSPS